jgi:hypothetical protein
MQSACNTPSTGSAGGLQALVFHGLTLVFYLRLSFCACEKQVATHDFLKEW